MQVSVIIYSYLNAPLNETSFQMSATLLYSIGPPDAIY